MSQNIATMQALVLSDINKLRLCQIPYPKTGNHSVLIKVSAVGICGTDFHIFSGIANYNTNKQGHPIALTQQPQVLGHEIVGVVVEIGKEVRDLRIGDRVVIDQGLNCWSQQQALCEYCTSEDSHQCQYYREHGITGLAGGFAEYISIPAVNAICIKSGLDDDVQAALTEPLGCIIHAEARVAKTRTRYGLSSLDNWRQAQSVLIFGAGPAGLLFIQYLRNVQKYEGLLLVSEPNPIKQKLAVEFGAEVTDAIGNDLVEIVQEKTKGRLIEYVIDACGAGTVMASLSRLIRKQATVLLYGYGHAGVDLSILNNLQFLEATLVCSTGASGGFDADLRPTTYRKALELITTKQIEVASWITHRYPSLESLSALFNGEYRDRNYIKGVLTLKE
ncbi:alcohol dehydrogenase catalytic domain-containing protein [uncultured Nostoc sp.]|uniref:zinc-dependent alcohol dehydrogenase n=1 Tax=uncultured Nostoc sp. TaxID=340711 RepID=UPI00262B2CFE|nr:alcohol dehydrogenase catalytic domain-containing protein [uncultured Nostoc sp.]